MGGEECEVISGQKSRKDKNIYRQVEADIRFDVKNKIL